MKASRFSDARKALILKQGADGVPVTADVRGKQRPEPVPPEPLRLVAKVDPAIEQQILHIAQAERETEIHHHHEAERSSILHLQNNAALHNICLHFQASSPKTLSPVDCGWAFLGLIEWPVLNSARRRTGKVGALPRNLGSTDSW